MTNDPIEQFQYNGYEISIYQDEYPSNPRKEFDQFSRLYTWESGHDSPDHPTVGTHPEEWWGHESTEEMLDTLSEYGRNPIVYAAPLFSGKSLVVGSPKDLDVVLRGGASGIALVHAGDFLSVTGREWTGTNRDAKDARGIIDTEVFQFNQWAEGDVHRYVIADPNGKFIDSCSGMYGLEYCITEAQNEAGALPTVKSRAERAEDVREKVCDAIAEMIDLLDDETFFRPAATREILLSQIEEVACFVSDNVLTILESSGFLPTEVF